MENFKEWQNIATVSEKQEFRKERIKRWATFIGKAYIFRVLLLLPFVSNAPTTQTAESKTSVTNQRQVTEDFSYSGENKNSILAGQEVIAEKKQEIIDINYKNK
jgi:hypothetical protein